MKYIDTFFDTFEKRSHFIYLVFIFCALLFSIFEIYVGFQLLNIHNYDEVLNLVNESYLQASFFGKTSLFLLNIQVFEFIEFIYNLLYSIEFHEKIYFLGILFCLFSNKQKIGLLNIISFVLTYVYIIIIFINAIYSTSVYHLISYIHMIAYGLIAIYLILLIVNMIQLIKTFIGYLDALKVEVIIEGII